MFESSDADDRPDSPERCGPEQMLKRETAPAAASSFASCSYTVPLNQIGALPAALAATHSGFTVVPPRVATWTSHREQVNTEPPR